jgi:glycosyltransferase involved in cell wall biosynthesis
LIAPDDGIALAQRLDTLVNAPELRVTMGAEGRRIVEARFDAARNTARLLDLTMDLCRRKEVARAGTPADQRHA